jgi:hypothetical protein
MGGFKAVVGTLVVLAASRVATAEGEYGPMVGGALIGTRSADQSELAGAGLELAVWRGRFGLAVEGARQWEVEGEGPRVTTLAASARVLVFSTLIPSLLEPSDVELGIEAQAIVERAWWENVAREPAPVSYGFGLAVRLRGGTDGFSNLLAESRVFLRVMHTRAERMDVAARDAMGAQASDKQLGVVVGLGVLFGGGRPGYVDRFRMHPFSAGRDDR